MQLTSNWITQSAFLLSVGASISEWHKHPRHHRNAVQRAVEEGTRLLDKLEHNLLDETLFERYCNLKRKFWFALDNGKGIRRFEPQHFSAMPVERVFELLDSTFKFLADVKAFLRSRPPLVSTSFQAVTPRRTPATPKVLRVVTGYSHLPAVMATWGVGRWNSVESDINAFLALAQSAYPQVPSEVALRWCELEQGSLLASKVKRWDAVSITMHEVTIPQLMTWCLDGYVPAEYQTPFPLNEISPTDVTWKKRPILMDSKLLHGVNDFRFVFNLPTRLKPVSAHEFWLIVPCND